jgi:hypothetical protein
MDMLKSRQQPLPESAHRSFLSHFTFKMVQPNRIVFWNFQTISFLGNFFFEVRGHFDVFLTSSSHDKGPTADWIVGHYCPKVPLSIGTTLGALG